MRHSSTESATGSSKGRECLLDLTAPNGLDHVELPFAGQPHHPTAQLPTLALGTSGPINPKRPAHSARPGQRPRFPPGNVRAGRYTEAILYIRREHKHA